METLALNFDSEYFAWLSEMALGGVLFGALLPFAFWGIGFVVDAFFRWCRTALKA